MYISDNGVFINYPKTGSTFIRTAIEEINTNLKSKSLLSKITRENNDKYTFNQILVPQIRSSVARVGEPDPHGVCDQIPEEYKESRIISVFRNPLDKLKSAYQYADFKKVKYFNDSALSKYPEFPNITFENFVDLYYTNPPGVEHIDNSIVHQLGPQTIQFIKFFGKDGINRLRLGDIDLSDKRMFYDVKFLRFNNLAEDLYRVLLEMGYKKKWINFILTAPKLNVSSGNRKKLEYREDQLELINEKEKFLINFEMSNKLC